MVSPPVVTFLKVIDGVAVDSARATVIWANAQPDTWIEASGGARKGWLWDGSAWSAPTPPTDAEKAAPLKLRRAAFFVALDAALGLTTSDPLIEDHVAAAIAASQTLSDADKRLALTLMSGATEFLRQDPDAPGLLDAVGAELGLASAAIDTLFLQTAGVS